MKGHIMRLFHLLVAASSLLLPLAAHADSVDNFSLIGNGLTLSFSLPSSPVPTAATAGDSFQVNNLQFVDDGQTRTAASASFFTASDDGGFSFEDTSGNVIDDLSFFSNRALFTGKVNAPTFRLGNYNLQTQSGDDCTITANGASCPTYALSITTGAATSVTPEPASLALLGTGVLAMLAFDRRRLLVS